MYYYIVNKKRVVGFEHEVDMRFNSGFDLLTPEQTEFYLKNPDATLSEILNCALYKEPETDPYEYANGRLIELKDICNMVITIPIQDYLLAIACVDEKSPIYTGARYYSSKEALGIIKQFMDESTIAHQTYDKYSKQMLSAKNGEGVDLIIESAKKELNYNE